MSQTYRFIAICMIAFAAAGLVTVYYSSSMYHEMKMPGSHTMSMLWRMPGQTWFASSLNFLLMWLAMMVVMMLPSALPMFLKIRRQWSELCVIASGYFTSWLIAGVAIYAIGLTIMQFEWFGRYAPLLLGASLMAAGAFQCSQRKMICLLHCRSASGCVSHEKSFRVGCKQGAACCISCTLPVTIQLVLGIMNPLVMIIVAVYIAAEKWLPRPALIVHSVGLAAMAAGLVMTTHWDLFTTFYRSCGPR